MISGYIAVDVDRCLPDMRAGWEIGRNSHNGFIKYIVKKACAGYLNFGYYYAPNKPKNK